MNYRIKFFFILLPVLFICCNRSTTRNQNLIKDTKDKIVSKKINLLKESNLFSFFDFFKKAEIIPLESKKEAIIYSQRIKYFKYGSYYYFLDIKQGKVVIFNNNGKFIKLISKKGRGPGEASSFYDFAINRFSGNLELMSPLGTILVYDKFGNNLIEKFNLPSSVRAVHLFTNLTPDIYVFFSMFEEKKLIFYSKSKNKIITSKYSCPDFIFEKSSLKFSITPFFIYNNQVRFYEGHNGNIYTINPIKYSIIPYCQWDMGSYNFELSKIEQNAPIEYYIKFARHASFNFATPFYLIGENDDFLLARFKFKNKLMSLIYNKKNNSYFIFKQFKEGIECVPEVVDNDSIYMCVDPQDLPIVINKNILDKDNINKLNRIKEDDNLILIKYIFK
jgi:hypothetical protein